MSLVQFLFSFEGRVRRLHMWLFFIALGVVYGGLFWQFGHFYSHGRIDNFLTPGVHSWKNEYYATWASHNLLSFLFGIASFWMQLAVMVKRWHDRNKSGWWILITLVPVIGWLWQFIECGFLDGTQGPNRYGPSPKGLGAPEKAF